jgi:hypothetical protein
MIPPPSFVTVPPFGECVEQKKMTSAHRTEVIVPRSPGGAVAADFIAFSDIFCALYNLMSIIVKIIPISGNFSFG